MRFIIMPSYLHYLPSCMICACYKNSWVVPFVLIFRPFNSKHNRLFAIIDQEKNQNFFLLRGNALVSLSVLRLYDMHFYYI